MRIDGSCQVGAGWLALLMAVLLVSCTVPRKATLTNPAGQPRLVNVDAMLAALRPTLRGYPPRVSSDEEREEVTRQWTEAERELTDLEQTFPDDPEIQWRLGVLYRFGHNLDIPAAGQKCISHLERAISLRPDYVAAYVELGIFYTDSGPPWPAFGEKNLRKAIALSGSTPLPRAWRALVFACYYQGKFADAVAAADRYLQLVPDDEGVRALRGAARRAVASGATGLAPAGRVTIP